MPPLNALQIIPVPPPTLPSSTGRRGRTRCVKGVLGFHVESVDVVEIAVVGFGDHGQRPPVAFAVGLPCFTFQAMTASRTTPRCACCDHDGAVEKAGVFEPCGARHFSVAVQREPGAEDRVVGVLAARQNRGDAGADGPSPT